MMMPHGELVGGLGGELGFPEPTIKMVASQPETGRQSVRTQDETVFAGRNLLWSHHQSVMAVRTVLC